MAFFQRLIRTTGRPTEPIMKTRIRQVILGQWIQVLQIEPEGTVLLQGHHFLQKGLHPARLAIGGQAHELVLAGVDPESAVSGQRRVQKPQRMREMDLLQGLNLGAVSAGDGGGGPFSNAIHCQDGRLGKGRRKKRTGRMCLVMGGEEDRALGPQPRQRGSDASTKVQASAQPIRNGPGKSATSPRGPTQKHLQSATELQDGFLVEGYGLQIAGSDARLIQTGSNGTFRKPRIILATRQSFLLHRRQNSSITQEGCRRVVVQARDAEDVSHDRPWIGGSEEGVQKRRDRRAGRKDHHRPEEQQDQDQGREPPFLLPPQESGKIFENGPHQRLRWVVDCGTADSMARARSR